MSIAGAFRLIFFGVLAGCPARDLGKPAGPATDAGPTPDRPRPGPGPRTEPSPDAGWDTIVARLGDPISPREKRSLLKRLVEIDAAYAIPHLEPAIADTSPEVRLGVARLVGQRRLVALAPALVKRFAAETDSLVVAEIAMSLALLRDPPSARALLALADSPLRDHAIGAARVIGVTLGSGALSEKSLATRFAQLADRSPEVRRDATRFLLELRDARALAPLSKLITTEADDQVLTLAVLALGNLRDRSAVPSLATLVRGLRKRPKFAPDHVLWERAFATIITLGGPDADRLLRDAASWPEVAQVPALRQRILRALDDARPRVRRP